MQRTPTQPTPVQPTSADPARPAARHAQPATGPATNAAGYARTPMTPLRPGDSGFLAGGFQDRDSQDARSQDRDFHDSRSQDYDFQNTRSQDSNYYASGSYPSAPPDIRFPSDGRRAGNRPPAPVEPGPTAEPAARPTAGPAARPTTASADRPDSPAPDDSEWGNSRWDTSPGPMGSRRPGRG